MNRQSPLPEDVNATLLGDKVVAALVVLALCWFLWDAWTEASPLATELDACIQQGWRDTIDGRIVICTVVFEKEKT